MFHDRFATTSSLDAQVDDVAARYSLASMQHGIGQELVQPGSLRLQSLVVSRIFRKLDCAQSAPVPCLRGL